MSDSIHDRVQKEVSIAHDEGRPVDPETRAHVDSCSACAAFADGLARLDQALARTSFDRAPDIASKLSDDVARRRGRWFSVAAAAMVGLVAGALIGGVGTRLETGRAQDLDELFHDAGTNLDGLSADVLVVERGVHEHVPERVYLGSLGYVAPERLSIELVDTTDYPSADWVPNDLQLTLADGDMVVVAGASCPVAGMPGCLAAPSTRAVSDLAPFDRGVVVPLELVGPGRSLTWPSGIEVLGLAQHGGRPAIQVRSTVAAVELIVGLVDQGAWRDFHPTDPVVMWLDEETLVPTRLEVFAADSAERQLWQIRRGYDDDPEQPILIVELSNLITEPPPIEIVLPDDVVSAGFVDGPVDVPVPELPDGFVPHRSGQRPLGEGGVAELATWSDGRSWVMVESTHEWDEPHLFGMSLPFVVPVDLGDGAIGYLSPSGDRVAIHGQDVDIVVTGSVPLELLVDIASSLDVEARPVPESWLEASTVPVSDLPDGTLVPEIDGWSTSARVDADAISILLTSGGSRSVLITQQAGASLAPPVGPDVVEVGIRGTTGRFDSGVGRLEWVEDGRIVELRSDTVGREIMTEIAESMRRQ